MRSSTRNRARSLMTRVGLVGGGAATAWLLGFFDKRRRHMARDRAAATIRAGSDRARRRAQYASGVVQGATHRAGDPLQRQEREYDDVTLARKVETELFRPADAPKDSVNVNVQNGVVELRGEVKRPEDVKHLGDAAAGIDGVRDVHNLLHTPGSPPKHSPASEPANLRARADEPKASSRFARNPATARPADEPLIERAPGQRGSGG